MGLGIGSQPLSTRSLELVTKQALEGNPERETMQAQAGPPPGGHWGHCTASTADRGRGRGRGSNGQGCAVPYFSAPGFGPDGLADPGYLRPWRPRRNNLAWKSLGA